MNRVTSWPRSASRFNGGADPAVIVKKTPRCWNLAGNRTSKLPSVGFEGCKFITSQSSRLSKFWSHDCLAPFEPRERFWGHVHMDSLTGLEAAHSLLVVILLGSWAWSLGHTDELFEGDGLPPQSSNLITCEGKFEGSTGLKCSREVCPDSYITKSILGKIPSRIFQPEKKP